MSITRAGGVGTGVSGLSVVPGGTTPGSMPAPWESAQLIRAAMAQAAPTEALPVIARQAPPALMNRDTFLPAWGELPNRLRLSLHATRSDLYRNDAYARLHAIDLDHVRRYKDEDAEQWWAQGVPGQRLFVLRHMPRILRSLAWPDRVADRPDPDGVAVALDHRIEGMMDPLHVLLQSFSSSQLFQWQFATAFIPVMESVLASVDKSRETPPWLQAMLANGNTPSYETLSPNAQDVLYSMSSLVREVEKYRADHHPSAPVLDVALWDQRMTDVLRVNTTLEHFRMLIAGDGVTEREVNPEVIANAANVMRFYNAFTLDHQELYALALAGRFHPSTHRSALMQPISRIVQYAGHDHPAFADGVLSAWNARTKLMLVEVLNSLTDVAAPIAFPRF